MTRDEILKAVSNDTMYSRGVVEDVVGSLFEVIENCLLNGEKAVIQGFGTFKTVERKARIGRNIKEGTPVHIPAHVAPDFKPSEYLKNKVKNAYEK